MTFSLSVMMMTSGDFTLTGFSSDTAIANAANGTFTMSSGEVFGYGESDNGKVIISKALADFNDLKVGDEITVTNPSDTSTTYTFTISGIYKNSTSSNTSAMGPMGGTSQDADNAIYTSVSTLKSLGLDADTTANDDDNNITTQLSYTYVLGSADDYETFASDVRQAGLDDTYTVQSADVENHESSLVPLDSLAKFALTLLIVVLAVGAVVLNLFNIRERKYEVGVLTAIGVKKVKVLSGGEKVRCMLSKLMISGANVLMLDEPTDHLDMESITALNNGMIKFPGVMIFSSRDHQIVQTTANRIMEIVNGKLIDKITTYDEYLESDEMARKRFTFTVTEADEADD